MSVQYSHIKPTKTAEKGRMHKRLHDFGSCMNAKVNHYTSMGSCFKKPHNKHFPKIIKRFNLLAFMLSFSLNGFCQNEIKKLVKDLEKKRTDRGFIKKILEVKEWLSICETQKNG